MIKEVNNLEHFNKLAKVWNKKENLLFWTSLSCRKRRSFDPDSIESNLRTQLINSIQNGDVLPYIKIWSYEEYNESLAGCVFMAHKNEMMNETIFKEVLWQMNGKLAGSVKEKSILLQLLKHAENYARSTKIKSIVITRDPNLHRFTLEKNSGINNYYTRNNYEASAIEYVKKLN